ncbi:sulfurtransferase [Nesterenkonia sp. CL21]|uniref:sulfurtransferase n=1 Tax=Nesterenkonia sp. CL21 TaxID=3064894 RepID=UPI002878469E|nr:sulfurtransferase [Nesterenkonia sp. CL21]MDS2173678.1 sulfurtransferase [Nesterenkonia sp. CL21]
MSTDEAPSPEQTSSSGRRSSGKLAIAFVAVAALAATAGGVVTNSISGGDDGAATSTDSGSGGGDQATTVANVQVAGEHRGYDEVHQGGDEDLENVLVSTDWLADRLDEGDLAEQGIVLIDVSEELPTSELTPYSEAHIPQAQYVNWSTEFTQPNTREFISQDEFTELAQSLGIDDGDTVVLYGDSNNWFAAYAAWVFKLYGAEDVRLLDGGLHKWEVYDERELTEEVPDVAEGTWEAQPQNLDIRALQPEVLEVAEENVDGESATTLVDIRSADEHDGAIGVDPEIFEGESTSIWGHIPGSVNVSWGTIVDEETGQFLPADEIRAIYEDAGVDLDSPIITYCRIGERASHTWFALSQILGADTQVYDGSWTEWGNSVGVPVANNTDQRAGLWGSGGS